MSTSPARLSRTSPSRPGLRLYKRLTFVAEEGRIATVIYPVFPPDGNADEVLRWLAGRAD